MRKEYDFSKGRRGPVVPPAGKSRITIMLDDDLLEHFRDLALAQGIGYQTLINATLRAAIAKPDEDAASQPLTAALLRQILREEFRPSPAG